MEQFSNQKETYRNFTRIVIKNILGVETVEIIGWMLIIPELFIVTY